LIITLQKYVNNVQIEWKNNNFFVHE